MTIYWYRKQLSRTFDTPRRAVRIIECNVRSRSGTLRCYSIFRLRYTHASTTPPLSTIYITVHAVTKKTQENTITVVQTFHQTFSLPSVLLYVALPVALEPPSAAYRSVIRARVFSIKSLRSVFPCGAQLPEFQGLHFGSLCIWSTASNERLDDSYRNRKTMTGAKRLHAG